MLILPRGITGFTRGSRDEVLPVVSPRDFARACHSAARALAGAVEMADAAAYPRNYHRAVIRMSGRAVAVLCNVYLPWIAIAAGLDEPLRFMTLDPLGARLRDAMVCETPDLAALVAPPDARSLASLAAVERAQVHYWRPSRVGDIIFNAWD